MMSLNDFLLYVLLLGVIGPILFSTIILYSTRKERTAKKQWQKMIYIAMALLGGSIALFIGYLLLGHDVSYAFSRVSPYLLLLVTVLPMTWLILMYVEKRTTIGKKHDLPQY